MICDDSKNDLVDLLLCLIWLASSLDELKAINEKRKWMLLRIRSLNLVWILRTAIQETTRDHFRKFLFYQGVVRNSLAWVSQSTSSQRNNVLPLEITRGKRWLDGTIVGRIYAMDDELVFERKDQFEDRVNFLQHLRYFGTFE